MSDSVRPVKLVCPSCANELWLDVPRVLSIVYACGKCGVSVEHSFLTLTTGIVKARREPPSESD